MDGFSWYTEERVRRANRPQELLEGAKSVISLALSYNTGEPNPPDSQPRGKIARYAWGDDYHDVIKKRLRKFVSKLPSIAGRPVSTRIFVDDGPMNDRAAAARAGIGWFGKNTNILTQSHGSWVFLAQVITDIPLEPDAPLKKTCGECVLCIDACPTGGNCLSLCHRQQALHFIPYHRATRRNPTRTSPSGRRLGFRVRHLSGCLPCQPQGNR
ncbi:Epoxyqueuosine reductase [Geodia barretti]|nr:Epoxyqueuosine reductase [Geodia barretti]